MSNVAEVFNRSGFSQFLNSLSGRFFRLAAGIVFIAVGYAYSSDVLGIASMLWGILPLSAGLFDVCYISAVLGGPLSGAKIRGLSRTT